MNQFCTKIAESLVEQCNPGDTHKTSLLSYNCFFRGFVVSE